MPQPSASLRDERDSMRSAACSSVAGKLGRLAELWRWLVASISPGYRPERHYMRGPGPKWHQRYADHPASAAKRLPDQDLARARANNLE